MDRIVKREGWKLGVIAAALMASCAAMLGGCGDDGGGTGGSGGTGGGTTTTTGNGGGDTTATGTGGSGGSGGGDTTTGTGGSGGGAMAKCLDPKQFEGLFTIEDPSLCAVAIYEAGEPLYSYQAPSWGAHGGILTMRPTAAKTGAVELVRWTAPNEATGALTSMVTTVDAMLPDLLGDFSDPQNPKYPDAYLSFPPFDLPFFGLTALGYTNLDQTGEIVLVKGSDVVLRYDAFGVYSIAAVPGDNGQGRLLYVGQSTLGQKTKADNGLYAADSCGTEAQPSLEPGKDASCTAPSLVSAWADASGPLVLDHDGNAFAVLSEDPFGMASNVAHGFAAASIARGAPPAEGTSLFEIPGSASSLAALAPTADADGIVAFQPSVYPDYSDVIAQHYAVNAGKIEAKGTPAALLKIASKSTQVTMVTDDQGRLWAGVPSDTKTTFVVIARAPK